MGNFHCVTSSCAKVVYREYLPPRIRWRYPNEDWKEIEGDDYAVEQEAGQCPTEYHAFGTLINLNLNAGGCRAIAYWRTKKSKIGSQMQSFQPVVYQNFYVGCLAKNGTHEPLVPISKTEYDLKYLPDSTKTYFLSGDEQSNCVRAGAQPFGYDFRLTDIVRVDDLPDDCGDCTFTIYKNQEIIYQEIRDVCPEVEKIPCKLSDEYKEITIDKLPYLERIEVVPYAYQNFGLGVYQAKIPDECLNIYKNITTIIIPQFQGFPTPTNTSQANYGFIAQICSHPSCPPPQYEVICDCNNCKSCPDNSCAVECDGHICCYDTSTGIAIHKIAIEYYCGGHL